MALDSARRSLGIRNILRKLRGTAPRPISPEDQIEGELGKEPESALVSQDEEAEGIESQGGPKARKSNPLIGR